MARSISLLDQKVAQADFFLEKLIECRFEFFEARCYADAFTSAARSVTFAMQAISKEVVGFESWYSGEQGRMKADPICRFFNSYRTANIHFGSTPVSAGTWGNGTARFFFLPSQDIPEVPDQDVVTCCQSYFRTVVDLVFRMYKTFPFEFDDRWHYTRESFESRGLSIEDAEESLGFPRAWTRITGSEEEQIDRWKLLRRRTSGPEIQNVFQKHLNLIVKGPDDSSE